MAMVGLVGEGEGELARPALCGTGLLLDRLQQLQLGQVRVWQAGLGWLNWRQGRQGKGWWN